MKAGLTINELAAKLEADKARMKDYVVDTRQLRILTSEDGTEVGVPGVAELVPTQHFHRQLGTDLGIRADLYDRLRGVHPGLFDHLVNGLLTRWPEEHKDKQGNGKAGKRMVRTYVDGGGQDQTQGIARAVLSDRYRRIDNFDIAEAVLPIIAKIPGVQIPSCDVTETRMYIKVVAPLTQRNLQDYIDPGVHTFLPEGNPDYVQAGFVLTNSEVGASAFSLQEMIYRLVCTNGLIIGNALRKTHVGSQVMATSADDLSIYRSETLIKDDEAFLMKVQDTVAAAVDEVRFDQLAAQFAATAAGTKIVEPVSAMKVLAPTVGLTESESNGALKHLIGGGDLSQFGAINALTRMAHDVESYDRSTELEELAASKVMAMSKPEWDRVALAAA